MLNVSFTGSPSLRVLTITLRRNKMVEGRGVEPHPILHQNPVFKAGRHTNAPALPSVYLASRQGFEPRPTVLETAMLPLNTSEIFYLIAVIVLNINLVFTICTCLKPILFNLLIYHSTGRVSNTPSRDWRFVSI